MLIFPAIDIIDGECVRLLQGQYNKKTSYFCDPLVAALGFEYDGAKLLHIVDLDGAKEGKIVNLESIRTIKKNCGLSLSVGGGIRNEEDVASLFALGVDRVILGTAAVKNKKMVARVLKQYGPGKIVVSIDAKDENVLISGWLEESFRTLEEFVEELRKMGISTIIFTDIERDGMLKGPNFKSIGRVIKSGLNVIAAGGISDFEDLRKLKEMGSYGAIIGKALYVGALDLRDALKLQKSDLAKRIIPCMDVKDGRVVKGTFFENLKDAGNPVELAKMYSALGADELVFLDITATIEGRKTLCEMVSRIAGNINIPFTVGGGVSSIEDIRQLLNNGADKISIGSAAVRNPSFVREAAGKFGSQCVVISVDAKRCRDGWEIFIDGGRIATKIDAIEFAREMERLGAGELLVNSLDRDGMREGYDLELLKEISAVVQIPVIASSGAGCKEDFLAALEMANVDAVLAASIFHYGQITIPDLKKYLSSKNVTIRL